MPKPVILKALLLPALFFFSGFALAQGGPSENEKGIKSEKIKPFKVLTSGKQITIQSRQLIKSVMVWTAGGHRMVEQKEINTTFFSFTVPSKENIIFIMIENADGKRYTEKIGVK